MAGITATDNTTSIGLVSKRGYRVLSSSLTAASDKWGAVTIHNVAMEKGSIHLALRNNVMTKVESIQKQLGTRFITHTRYGLKTFSE